MKYFWILTAVVYCVSATVCPDGNSCSGDETCCKISSEDYGCCQYSDAVCCSDMEHCCPSGYTCSDSRCFLSQNVTIDFEEKKIFQACPDRKNRCLKHFTCCQVSSELNTCCPLPNANCCEDTKHCCPSDTKCNIRKGRCEGKDFFVPLIRKVGSVPIDSENLISKTKLASNVNNVCPDHQHVCTGSDPCCLTPSGVWTCCPYPYGTCCSDGYHCCPYGLRCIQSSVCVKDNVNISVANSIPTRSSFKDKNIICPDQHQCPNGNTCCKMSNDNYGCCPLPNAVCCSDNIHCCPKGMTCNIASGICSDGLRTVPWVEKIINV